MNWPQLAYRVRVGGLPWLFKTALGFSGRLLKKDASAKAPYDLGNTAGGVPEILHIHPGWAVETVSRLWFAKLRCARVHFVAAGDPVLTPDFMAKFDLVWYGYSSLFWQHPSDRAKAVIAVHDPAELFPDVPGWKAKGTIDEDAVVHFNSIRAVVVLSEEMQQIFANSGVNAYRIPTCSQVPLRDAATLHPEPAAFLAVGRIYRRKNFEQFQRLAKLARARFGIPSRLKHDQFPSAKDNYLELLDRYPIYLCTSLQEGGPLPAMDAMRRGAVVLSTAVGQIPEIIRHGENGFICQTDDEFLAALALLAEDPDKLLEMRRKALISITSVRSEESIAGTAEHVVQAILAEIAPAPP